MNAELEKLAKDRATLCRVFGNTRRILILWALRGRELPVTEIAGFAGTSLQNISQHLAVLKRFDIVKSRRDGQTIYYQLSDCEWLEECPVILQGPKIQV